MKKFAATYRIKNTITNEVYIGATHDYEKRKAQHLSVMSGKFGVKKPSYSMQKLALYGQGNFSFKVLNEFNTSRRSVFSFERILMCHAHSNGIKLYNFPYYKLDPQKFIGFHYWSLEKVIKMLE